MCCISESIYSPLCSLNYPLFKSSSLWEVSSWCHIFYECIRLTLLFKSSSSLVVTHLNLHFHHPILTLIPQIQFLASVLTYVPHLFWKRLRPVKGFRFKNCWLVLILFDQSLVDELKRFLSCWRLDFFPHLKV